MREPSAKDIRVAPISSKDGNRIIRRLHYSGKVVNNSQLHLGVFLGGRLEGAMQFGPSMVKRGLQGLVEGTKWNGFIELNRLAFSERLPRNSESRALGIALRIFKNQYPQIEWILSFADGCQCGDGTIYRAAGFVLTAIRKNTTLLKLMDGSVVADMTLHLGKHILKNGAATNPEGSEKLPGYQFRYIYFLNESARNRLTVPIIPFSRIEEQRVGMYMGKPTKRQKKHEPGHPPSSGRGSTDPGAPNSAAGVKK